MLTKMMTRSNKDSLDVIDGEMGDLQEESSKVGKEVNGLKEQMQIVREKIVIAMNRQDT